MALAGLERKDEISLRISATDKDELELKEGTGPAANWQILGQKTGLRSPRRRLMMPAGRSRADGRAMPDDRWLGGGRVHISM